MKNNLCPTEIKQCAASMWESVKRPTVRQTLHYELSLLPGKTASQSDSWTLRLGGTHVCPLWKLLLLATAAVITVAVFCKCKCKCEDQKSACHCQ